MDLAQSGHALIYDLGNGAWHLLLVLEFEVEGLLDSVLDVLVAFGPLDHLQLIRNRKCRRPVIILVLGLLRFQAQIDTAVSKQAVAFQKHPADLRQLDRLRPAN